MNTQFSTVALPITNNLQVPLFELKLASAFQAHGLQSDIKGRLVSTLSSILTEQLKNAPLSTPHVYLAPPSASNQYPHHFVLILQHT